LIPNLTLKKAIAEFAADPGRAHLIEELSVRQVGGRRSTRLPAQ
jgi:hypothetical protein